MFLERNRLVPCWSEFSAVGRLEAENFLNCCIHSSFRADNRQSCQQAKGVRALGLSSNKQNIDPAPRNEPTSFESDSVRRESVDRDLALRMATSKQPVSPPERRPMWSVFQQIVVLALPAYISSCIKEGLPAERSSSLQQ